MAGICVSTDQSVLTGQLCPLYASVLTSQLCPVFEHSIILSNLHIVVDMKSNEWAPKYIPANGPYAIRKSTKSTNLIHFLPLKKCRIFCTFYTKCNEVLKVRALTHFIPPESTLYVNLGYVLYEYQIFRRDKT